MRSYSSFLYYFLNRFIFLVAVSATSLNDCCAQEGSFVPANQLTYPVGSYHFNFQWLGDSISGSWEPHSALLIPVTFTGCNEIFYMQFDLGSPFTLMYSNKLAEIRAEYPDLLPAPDTALAVLGMKFRIGTIPVTSDTIATRFYPDKVSTGIKNKANRPPLHSQNIIGTIGADLIDNRVFIIDYINRSISIEDEVPTAMNKKLKFQKFFYSNRSVLLPVKINDRPTILFFDTGSSAFELLTDKATALALSIAGAEALKAELRSWDRMLTSYTTRSNAEIEMATRKLRIQHVTYIEGASKSQLEMMMKLGIGGMTGNKLFAQSVLVLDTRNQRFAVGVGKRHK